MHRTRPTLPLIVLTGAAPGTSLEVYEQGAVILWHKPISPTELLENLKALIHF
jgi:DNA-binding response OmpR family regulator